MSMSNTDYLDDQLAALQNAYAVFTSTSCFDKDDCDGLLRCMQVLAESCVQSPATRRRNHKHAAENRLKRSKRDQYHAEQKRLWTNTATLARSIFEANALISEREFHMCRLIASLDFSNDIVIKEVGDVLRESHMKHLQRKVHLLKKYKHLTNSDFVLTPDFVPNKAPTSPNKAPEGPSNTSNMLKPKKIPRIKHSRDFGVKASESQLSKSEKEAKHLLASDKACKTGKGSLQSGLSTRQCVADFDDSFGQNQKHQDFQKHQEHQEHQEHQTHQYVHGHQHQKQHRNQHQKLTTGRVANRHLRSSSSFRTTRRKDHSEAGVDDHQVESSSTSTNSGLCSPHTSQHTQLIQPSQPSHPKKLQMKSFLVCPEQPGVESLLQQTEQSEQSEQSEVSGRSEKHLHSVQQIDVQQADHTYHTYHADHAETHQADSDCDASAGAEDHPDKFQVDQTGNLNKKHKKHKSHKSMRKSFLNKKHKHKHAQAYRKPYLSGSDEETGCSQKSHSSRKSQIKQTSHASQKSRESYKSDKSYRSDKSKESSKSHKSKESHKSHRSHRSHGSQHSNRSEHSGHSEKSYESSEQEPVHLPKVYFVNHVALVGQIPRIASKSQTQQNSQGFSNATSPANSEGFEQQGNLHDLQSEQALVVPLPASQQQHHQQQQHQMEYSDLEQLVGEVFRAAAELEDIDSSSEDSG